MRYHVIVYKPEKDFSMENKTILNPSTFKTIDAAVLDYYKQLNLFVETNEGSKSVPVFWAGSELAYQTKDTTIRDEHGMLIMPQIVIRREELGKNMKWKGSYYSILPKVNDVKGGVISWTKKIKKDKTSDFARANSIRKTGAVNFKTGKTNEEVVYEHISIPAPVYTEQSYVINVRTEYQQQINEILQKIMTVEGTSKFVPLEKDGWKFESFYDDSLGYKSNVSEFLEDERMFKAEIKLKVLGYIIGGGQNEDQPVKVRRENAVKISLSENIFTGSF